MEEKARATLHNGRHHSDGKIYSLKHYDQNREDHPNVDPARVQDNRVWLLLDAENVEDCCVQFYEQHFSKALVAQNKRNDSRGQSKRNKTIKDLINSPLSCPEDSEIYGGDKDHAPDPDVLWGAAVEWTCRMHERFPNWQPLALTLHADEQGAPHVDCIQCWIGHDRDGNEVESQNKALKEMGFEYASRREGATRYVNAKIAFTDVGRKLLQEILISRGIDLETQPRPKSQSGLSMLDYKVAKANERLADAEQRVQDANERAEAAEIRASNAEAKAAEWKAVAQDAQQEVEQAEADKQQAIGEAKQAVADAQGEVQQAKLDKSRVVREKTNELNGVKVELDDTKKKLVKAQNDLKLAEVDLENVRTEATEMVESTLGWMQRLLYAWETSVEAFKQSLSEHVPEMFKGLAERALKEGNPWRDYLDAGRAMNEVSYGFMDAVKEVDFGGISLDASEAKGWDR